jgi:hypothetical protein
MTGGKNGFLISGRWGVARFAPLLRLTSVVVRGLLWVIARPLAWQADDRNLYL